MFHLTIPRHMVWAHLQSECAQLCLLGWAFGFFNALHCRTGMMGFRLRKETCAPGPEASHFVLSLRKDTVSCRPGVCVCAWLCECVCVGVCVRAVPVFVLSVCLHV